MIHLKLRIVSEVNEESDESDDKVQEGNKSDSEESSSDSTDTAEAHYYDDNDDVDLDLFEYQDAEWNPPRFQFQNINLENNEEGAGILKSSNHVS